MADSIISPSDGDTSEEEEYTRIMSTNNATVVKKMWMKLPIHPILTTPNLFQFLSPIQALNISTCVSFYTS